MSQSKVPCKLEIERRLAGLTQTALARKAKIHSVPICHYENGNTWYLKDNHRAAIAKILGFTVEELFEQGT